ncbi:hypothetical protein AM493_09540 [Flavobacterium akiainvivens]|uniref:DUF4468 domain-containing protein n=1 Tax=Flavobacterium akiainvivens TaxID=1202724 RepID=A0A0M9VI37_9FLAO|nr:hypothetical protein [Flavobacterium akiainvivens]KOS06246.1 hypothetical protein AM493_09540 [Flavobacterium akiainvivens]SFQ18038.1 hypothetical protein SAMN05444144_101457 [Flavobacterium akiainvivens]
MKWLAVITCLVSAISMRAQPAEAQVSNRGIEPFETAMPAMLPERFIDITKAWAQAFTRKDGGYTASDVTANSITISAFKKNAFRYQNTGETVENKIRYSLVISFTQSSYTLKFVVSDIYGDNDVLLTYKLPNYYKPDGTLKEGYDGLETSLKATINEIVQSHYSYVVNYK